MSERSERDRHERRGAGGVTAIEQRARPRFIDPAEIYKTSRAHLFPLIVHSLRDTRENVSPRDTFHLISEQKVDPK